MVQKFQQGKLCTNLLTRIPFANIVIPRIILRYAAENAMLQIYSDEHPISKG